MILKLGLEKKKNIGYNILSSLQIWFIGRTLASQAGKAGSTPVICFVHLLKKRESRYPIGFHAFSNYIFSQQCCCFHLSRTPNHFRAFQMPSLSTSVVI